MDQIRSCLGKESRLLDLRDSHMNEKDELLQDLLVKLCLSGRVATEIEELVFSAKLSNKLLAESIALF